MFPRPQKVCGSVSTLRGPKKQHQKVTGASFRGQILAYPREKSSPPRQPCEAILDGQRRQPVSSSEFQRRGPPLTGHALCQRSATGTILSLKGLNAMSRDTVTTEGELLASDRQKPQVLLWTDRHAQDGPNLHSEEFISSSQAGKLRTRQIAFECPLLA